MLSEIEPIFLQSGAKLYPSSAGLLPSVTTVLKATESVEKRQRLERWRDRNGRTKAAQLREKAAQRGTAIHRLIECYAGGGSIEPPDELKPFWEQACEFLKNVSEIQLSEHRVENLPRRYAGSLDLAARWFDSPTIIDFKTSSQLKRSAYLEDARHQLAAYWGGLRESGNADYEKAAIVVLSPKQMQCFSLDSDELERYWESWLRRLEAYHNLPTGKQLLADFIELAEASIPDSASSFFIASEKKVTGENFNDDSSNILPN